MTYRYGKKLSREEGARSYNLTTAEIGREILNCNHPYILYFKGRFKQESRVQEAAHTHPKNNYKPTFPDSKKFINKYQVLNA